MKIIFLLTIIAITFLSLTSTASVKQTDINKGVFFKKATAGEKLIILPSVYSFPSISKTDKGGRFGDLVNTAQTAAGLAALAVSEKKYDSLVWFTDWEKSPDGHISKYYLDNILGITGMKQIEMSPLDMIKSLADKNIIKGYILYKRDDTVRNAYDEYKKNDYAKHSSANAATSLAPILKAVMVEEDSENIFKEIGLKCLMDVRDKNEAWFFDNYKKEINRNIVFVIDPKVPDNRDFAVFSKGIVVYGNTDFESKVYNFLDPNTPIIGWGCGDEYHSTSLLSKNAIYNTASNWYFNMPIHTVIRAGKDIKWDKLQLNNKINPLTLEWKDNVHYTSYLLSDGDNVQWTVGNFIKNPSYWGNEDRGKIPYGWGLPIACETDLSPLTLLNIAETKTENDGIFTGGLNGYFYLDEYAQNRENKTKILGELAARTDDVLSRYNITTAYIFTASNWKSQKAMEAYQILADNMPNMDGFFVVQYSPYNAGLGEIIWIKNKNGKPIPVIPARFAMWKGLRNNKFNGSPAPIADFINNQAHQGAITNDAYIDWTVVHAWSSFKKSNTDINGLWSEEDNDGDTAGYTPAIWSVNKLKPYVEVVKPDELTWQARLHLATKDTLLYLANSFIKTNKTNKDIIEYIAWLKNQNLDTENQKKEAFQKLAAIAL